MVTLVFKGLCGCLYLLGLLLGWTYKECSVYICIYMCPIVCILCSLVSIIPFNFRKFWDRLWISINFSLFISYIWITFKFWKHYDCADPFTKCMQDLIGQAQDLNMTYEELNLFIYCYLFFGIIAFHTIPTIIKIIINNKHKNYEKEIKLKKETC